MELVLDIQLEIPKYLDPYTLTQLAQTNRLNYRTITLKYLSKNAPIEYFCLECSTNHYPMYYCQSCKYCIRYAHCIHCNTHHKKMPYCEICNKCIANKHCDICADPHHSELLIKCDLDCTECHEPNIPHCSKCNTHHYTQDDIMKDMSLNSIGHEFKKKYCDKCDKCVRHYNTVHCDICKKCYSSKSEHCNICGMHVYDGYIHCEGCDTHHLVHKKSKSKSGNISCTKKECIVCEESFYITQNSGTIHGYVCDEACRGVLDYSLMCVEHNSQLNEICYTCISDYDFVSDDSDSD